MQMVGDKRLHRSGAYYWRKCKRQRVGETRLHRSRAYYWRKCKRQRGTTNIASLPDELLLEILSRLPADDLHYKARVVCRRWCHQIHSDYFIKTQLHRSTYGLLVPLIYHATFMTATQGRIETSDEIPYDDTAQYSRSRCSCNGLFLQHHRHGEPMRIINPVIRRQLVLPSFSCPKMITRCCMGYAADSMEYKVVLSHTTTDHKDPAFLAILSVGNDKSWRHVGVEHLSEWARNLLHEVPLITEGFIFWPNSFRGRYLKLDVETEILTLHPSPLPEACKFRTYSFYLSTGRSLSLLVAHDYTKYLMELWEMKVETGEWRRVVGDIKLGAHKLWLQQFCKGRFGFLMPVGWVRYPEVLALYFFDCGNTCILFNLNTQQISSMELPSYYFSHAHKKSLAWFT